MGLPGQRQGQRLKVSSRSEKQSGNKCWTISMGEDGGDLNRSAGSGAVYVLGGAGGSSCSDEGAWLQQ